MSLDMIRNVAAVYIHPLSQGGASNSHYDGNSQTYMDIGEAMVGLLKHEREVVCLYSTVPEEIELRGCVRAFAG